MCMPVALYLRVSTEEQRERQSIATQREFAERYCALTSCTSALSMPMTASPAPCRCTRVPPAPASSPTLACTASIICWSIVDRLGRDTRLTLQAVAELESAACASRASPRTSIPPPPAAASCSRCCPALPPTNVKSSANVPGRLATRGPKRRLAGRQAALRLSPGGQPTASWADPLRGTSAGPGSVGSRSDSSHLPHGGRGASVLPPHCRLSECLGGTLRREALASHPAALSESVHDGGPGECAIC